MKYRTEMGTLKELMEKANKDSDAVSCFVNGEDWEHCDGVVIVVKGRDAAFRVANVFANAGMRTPNKPVVDHPNEVTMFGTNYDGALDDDYERREEGGADECP